MLTDHRAAVRAVAVTFTNKPEFSYNKVITDVAELLGYGVSSVGHAYNYYEKHGHFAVENETRRPRGGGVAVHPRFPTISHILPANKLHPFKILLFNAIRWVLVLC